MKIIFFLSLFLIFYIYIGYYLLLLCISFFKKKSIDFAENSIPSLSIIIAAYNEENVIEEKIKNTIKLDYPKDKLEILVFSDASNDNTDKIVKHYVRDGVKLLRIEGRKGKTFCQNQAVEIAKGEIIVFSDANSMYAPDALRMIVRPFTDEKVGCVSGELKYYNDGKRFGEKAIQGEGVYWSYEQKLKKLESQISSVVSTNGAIYALRKRNYIPLNEKAISDFVEPLKIFLNNYRIIYEPGAVAWENTAKNWQEEYSRRVRIVTRAFANFIGDKDLLKILNPFRFGIFSIQLLSHKLLRWFTGLFLFILLFSSLLIYKQSMFYRFIFWGQIIFYLLSLHGLSSALTPKMKSLKVADAAFHFCFSCWAMLRGIANALSGKSIVTWEVNRR